ncbi:MAG TPA: trypsin-like peptidase domain-containing protein [Vicinamibacterales bacterium]|nr:trypsin-like peptidase domain-containing protein [Vicinamibacterales bacterium]
MPRRLVLALLLLICGFVAGLVVTGRMRSATSTVAQPPEAAAPAVSNRQVAAGAAAVLPDFSAVAERTVNAVTNISSLQVIRRRNSPFADDPFFQYFFGDTDLFGESSRRELSLGSGVVVSSDGYVLTNNHVLGQQGRAARVTVTLADKRELLARVVGVDDWTDIALLKIDANGLPVIPWGDSSTLRVADWVLAIGNPFQLNQTVTLGIVSALGRANIGAAAYEDFIQTDAAINPGNSGGALVNARGELVGINTAIYSQSGGYQGVGFAVPSNLARRVMQDLIRYGEVRRASIGRIELVPLTSQLAERLGVDTTRGAVVWRMARDSAAYAAGIRPGDVIVSFNGTEVEDTGHFLRLLSDSKIGSVAEIGILRGSERIDVKVRLREPEPRRRGV